MPPVVLQMEKVLVQFDDKVALDHIDFSLREGETCIILGAAGSGKTVLLKTALGLIRPDQGRVTVFGKDTADLTEREWMDLRSQVGILFQEGALFDSLTIEENVGYPLENIENLRCPPEEVRSRVQETLDFVELGHTLEKVPSELSGGMRRRVGIARAIVAQPKMVLYDSPTAGLDPITANRIMALIAKERDIRRMTTALATHRYQDGQLLANYHYDEETKRLVASPGNDGAASTRFVVLDEGRIAFEGSQAELEASTDPYVSKFGRRWKD